MFQKNEEAELNIHPMGLLKLLETHVNIFFRNNIKNSDVLHSLMGTYDLMSEKNIIILIVLE